MQVVVVAISTTLYFKLTSINSLKAGLCQLFLFPFLSLKYPHHLSHHKSTHYPLIDGIYAIAMTLLALEFPDLFVENIFNNDLLPSTSSKVIVSGLLFAEYFIIFLMLYEIWCFHRAILHSDESSATRKENLLSTCILILIAFLPSSSTITCKAIIKKATLIYSSGSIPLDTTHHLHYFPQLLIFLALFIATRASSSFKISHRLKGLSKHLLCRILFFIFLVLISFSISFIDPSLASLLAIPTIPFLIYIAIFIFDDWFLEKLLGRFYE